MTALSSFVVERLESRVLLAASPVGMTPAMVRTAYGFDKIVFNSGGQAIAGDGSGQTIAIVTAYDDSRIVRDLHAFDAAFGLSNHDSTGRPALTKLIPAGSIAIDRSWAQETALDVEWAHAIAPGAHILLVEASSSSLGDLLNAVDVARQQPGVVAVSMSWGGSEFPSETSLDPHMTTPAGHIGGGGLPGGVTFVAASGDSASTSWPAVSPNVLSVGGTTLNVDSSGNRISETAWNGGGGGRALFEKNTNPTVAYNADPATGFAVYDSLLFQGQRGWMQFGGTSTGTPQWAGLIAIADQGRTLIGKGSLDGATQTIPALFSHPHHDFFDIVTGSNGVNAAAVGYDLVTGLGSPKAWHVATDLLAPGASPAAVPVITPRPVKTTLPALTLTGSARPLSSIALANPGALPLENLPAGWRASMASRFSGEAILLGARRELLM